MSSPEPLRSLEAAGVPVDRLPETHRQVLASMASEEVAVLISVMERLQAVAPEVEAHTDVAGAMVF